MFLTHGSRFSDWRLSLLVAVRAVLTLWPSPHTMRSTDAYASRLLRCRGAARYIFGAGSLDQ